MAEKKSFILYFDNEKQVNMLTNEQAGMLFKALFKFAKTGEETEFEDLAVSIVYGFISDSIRRDTEKYDKVCQKNSENGKKGGRPTKAKKADGFSENPDKAKKADNDNEIEIDNEIENENDNEIDNEIEKDKNNEKEKEKEKEKCSINAINSEKIQNFIFKFRNICHSFVIPEKITSCDIKNIDKIISYYQEDEISNILQKIEDSNFLRKNKKTSFSWLINPVNFIDIYCSKYKNAF